MKKLVVLGVWGLVLVFCPNFARSQGTILFQNIGPGFNAQLREWCSGVLITNGAPITAELLAGTNANTMVPVGITTTNWVGNGWFGVGDPEKRLDGFPPGSLPFLQVRIWRNAGGAVKSYEEAIAQGLPYGSSQVWQLIGPYGLGNPDSAPPLPAPPLFGMTGFQNSGGLMAFAKPQSQTVFEGGTAVFTVTAGGGCYSVDAIQWQRLLNQTNWVDVAGATSTNLVINPVSLASAGEYRVIARSGDLLAVSPTVSLLVMNVPEFTLLALNPADSSFSLTMLGQPRFDYRVDASTNLVDWVPIASFTNFDGAVRLTEPNIRVFPWRFYRAIVLNP